MPIQIHGAFTASGTFTIPTGLSTIGVAAWASGGLGDPGGISGGAGGGASALAFDVNAACTAGTDWSVSITPNGDTLVKDHTAADVVKAVSALGATGGAAASCIGAVTISGQNGGAGGTSNGGGGAGAPGVGDGTGSAGTAGVAGDSGGTGGAGGTATHPYTSGDPTHKLIGGAGGLHGNPAVAGATPGGGGGGGDVGAVSGGAGGGGKVIFFTTTVDVFQENMPRLYPIPGTDFQKEFPGAVIFLRSLAAAEPTPPITPSGPPSRVRVETPSPPPFPGAVHQVLNQYGVPVPAVATGDSMQVHVETPAPPPFPGDVLTVNLRAPVQPGAPDIGAVGMVGPPGLAESPPFPGDVRTAPVTKFGASPLPSRPVRIETESPPAFPGGLVGHQPRVETVRPAHMPPPDVRTAEPPPEVRQPTVWSGTLARAAVGPPVQVVETAGHAPFPGAVVAKRSDFGLSPIPARPIVARLEPGPSEPGRVIVSGGRVETTRLPSTPLLASVAEGVPDLHQPVVWGGTPARAAVGPPVRIVAPEPPPAFPGEVISGRSAFGVAPLPSRPIMVKLDPSEVEPGRVIFSRPFVAVPLHPPPVRVAAEWSSALFAGDVIGVMGRTRPAVFQRYSVVVRGEMEFSEVVQPYFSWGQRNLGSNATPLVGAIVYLTGADHSVVTIDSENWDCDC